MFLKNFFLTGSKIPAKIPNPSGYCVLGQGQLYTLHLMVKVKGYSIQHEQDTRQELLYLIHYDTLLPKARDIITKCDGYFITKCNRSSLQNVSGFLLQNETVLLQNRTIITKCNNFITKCNSY